MPNVMRGCRAVLSIGATSFFVYASVFGDSLEELKAQPGVVEYQNEIVDAHNLPRMKDERDVVAHVKSGYLVRVPKNTKNFYLDWRMRPSLRYACPETIAYLNAFGAAYRVRFGHRLKVTSLVRTATYQRMLVRRGMSTADGALPERRSAHLTGMAFDISIKGMSRVKIKWLGDYLMKEKIANKIVAIYEPWSNNFHVMVMPQ